MLRVLAAIAISSLCGAAHDAVAEPPAKAPDHAPAPTPSSDAGRRSAPLDTPSAVTAAPGAPRSELVDALGSGDIAELERAVAAIARMPAQESDPDALFAAARACEDKLLDPGRAVALYERVVAEHPAARFATVAARRVAALRELVGPRGESAAEAAELARLIGSADALPVDAVIARGRRLADAAWAGAPTAAVWLADWLRRTRRLAQAQQQYAAVVTRWPGRPQAEAALRGAAGCALEARDWALAEALASRLPVTDAAAKGVRDDLLAAAARGQRRSHWYVAAWVAIVAAFAALLGSLAEAIARSPHGRRRTLLRPPIEVVFFAPVALVLVGVAFTAHGLIAPAVAVISAGGLALSWLSGATLEALRAGERSRRARAVAHVVVCLIGVASLAYVALTREDLIDTVIETVRFGPEG